MAQEGCCEELLNLRYFSWLYSPHTHLHIHLGSCMMKLNRGCLRTHTHTRACVTQTHTRTGSCSTLTLCCCMSVQLDVCLVSLRGDSLVLRQGVERLTLILFGAPQSSFTLKRERKAMRKMLNPFVPYLTKQFLEK